MCTTVKPILNLADAPQVDLSHGDYFEAHMRRLAQPLGAQRIGSNVTTVPPGKTAFPFHHHRTGTVKPETLARVLKHFEGTHDFSAFATAVERTERKLQGHYRDIAVKTTRHVYSVDLVQEDAQWGFYRIDVCLQGALYKQVRNMVGTALVVAAASDRDNGDGPNERPGDTAVMTESDLVALLQCSPDDGSGRPPRK